MSVFGFISGWLLFAVFEAHSFLSNEKASRKTIQEVAGWLDIFRCVFYVFTSLPARIASPASPSKKR
jgi:hypothetical protein